jgi:hypothetical protein
LDQRPAVAVNDTGGSAFSDQWAHAGRDEGERDATEKNDRPSADLEPVARLEIGSPFAS